MYYSNIKTINKTENPINSSGVLFVIIVMCVLIFINNNHRLRSFFTAGGIISYQIYISIKMVPCLQLPQAA